MAKTRKQTAGLKAERPERAKLSPNESLKGVEEFGKRKEHLVAAVRKGKDRGLPAGSADRGLPGSARRS
jgi:hypothetical protein